MIILAGLGIVLTASVTLLERIDAPATLSLVWRPSTALRRDADDPAQPR
jgi:hypothetical protein